MLRKILNKIRNRYLNWLNAELRLEKHATSTVRISDKKTKLSGTIVVGKGSTLIIEEGVKFEGKLFIGENCVVHIGEHCSFINIKITVIDRSELQLAKGCIFDASPKHANQISVEDNSKMILKEFVRIQGDVLVRFNATLTIGTYSSINWGSEIRCEERITIGEYCLMSYEVCIYDTNTHSTDWKDRRAIIPNRADENSRPLTTPVVIGNDVWIGKGATILKGATIGDKSKIGIRTVVVAGTYPEDSVIVSPKPIVLIK